MKAKIPLMIIIIPLIFYWFYNVSNFTMLLKDPYDAKTSNNFQEIQANTMIIADSMKNAIFTIIPIVLLGFSLYEIYKIKTKLFGVIGFDKINRHIIILGATGSGKTTLAKKIIKKVMKKRNIIILDWHGEYDDLQSLNFEKITFDDKVSFNIFDCWTINPKKYIVFLTNSLKDILELSEPQTYILLKALQEEYEERGYFKEKKEIPIPPDINDVLKRIQKMAPRSRFDYEVKVALEETPTFSSLLVFFLCRRGVGVSR